MTRTCRSSLGAPLVAWLAGASLSACGGEGSIGGSGSGGAASGASSASSASSRAASSNATSSASGGASGGGGEGGVGGGEASSSGAGGEAPPPWSGLGVHPGEVALSAHGGTYPRAAQLPGGAILAAFDSGDGGNLMLRTSRSQDLGASWSDIGAVASHPAGNGRSLANAHPLALGDGSILAAFRHHSQEGASYVFRLLVSKSTDGGAGWGFLSEIEVGTKNGVWEPFLFQPPGGGLHVYYAREKTNGEQDIVLRRSSDGGASWGPLHTVATQAGSRDGMPSVVTLADGSLIAIFESFRAPHVPKFVVRTVQSNDGGATWPVRRDVYVPADGNRNAGAPFVAVLGDGRLVASFMTDEDSPSLDWPNHASLKLIVSEGIPTFDAVAWRPGAVVAAEAPVYWPALFVAENDDILVLYDKAGPKMRRAHYY